MSRPIMPCVINSGSGQCIFLTGIWRYGITAHNNLCILLPLMTLVVIGKVKVKLMSCGLDGHQCFTSRNEFIKYQITGCVCMYFLAWSSKKCFWTNAIRVKAQGQLRLWKLQEKIKKAKQHCNNLSALNLSCSLQCVSHVLPGQAW